MKEYLVGVDIGGTKCAVILGKTAANGVEIIDRISFPTETSLGPEQAINRLDDAIRSTIADNGLSVTDIEAIGISCGGPLDSRKGLILSPPNLPGWDNIPIVDRFQSSFDIPAYLQNDANACALAEWKWGAGQGCRNMIFLTFGTGLGAGLILNGKLYTGANDFAGEVGHVRLADDGPVGYGKKGSFEGFCSGGGISRLARRMIVECWSRNETVAFCDDESKLELVTAATVSSAARAGDPIALRIMNEVARYLGRGLSMLIDILNPEMIVIGSIFARQQDLLWPAAKQIIDQEALPAAANACKVVPAELGEAIGDYASLSVALNKG